jgi:hypothetical protein
MVSSESDLQTFYMQYNALPVSNLVFIALYFITSKRQSRGRERFTDVLTTNYSLRHIIFSHVRFSRISLKSHRDHRRRYFRLNTRQIVRGRGTDGEVSTNNTNMFHLGTARVPTVGGIEVDRERQWDTEKVFRILVRWKSSNLIMQ